MAAVASAPRTLRVALDLLHALDDALALATRLEEVAYEEVELGFMFAAREMKKTLTAHKETLEKLIKSKTG